ncbi:hypothetical protein C6990_05320 [Nitrosopumilus sp. b3]|uniref:hypothetical protein n=1 Tax=Nitrosopumilus sp. b3 TaxID=2109909 RepID=UPI0015F6E463|nr:hypothetical protein [Nitrosopumilus sp. b3]KAF6247101.1 hypothetical protein C6990_05320 [Nitrosopumilus sp. b3]
MGSIATIFFICIFSIAVALSVVYDFMFWLLIAFGGALVFLLSALFLGLESDEPRPVRPTWNDTETRRDPTRFERNLRGRIEDEYNKEDWR